MELPDTIAKIEERIILLEKYLSYLKKFQPVSEAELKRDFKIRGAIERYLQLAIEACIDIAELIISDQRLPVPHSAADAITTLGEEGILNKAFANKFSKAVKFRNILVHDYVVINYQKVSHYLKNNLSDFHRFIKEIVTYLK